MKIVTHNGKFHADEVMATAILMTMFPHATLTRTRDRKIIEEADVAVDVGGGCFDHHQRGGNGQRPNGVAYSSIGLIWAEYGRRYVYEIVKRKFGDMISGDAVTRIKNKIDATLIQELDMIDNGVIKGKERMATCLSNIVASMNCSWIPASMTETEAERFRRAQAVCLHFLNDTIEGLCAKELAKVMLERDIADSPSRVLVLGQFYPWQETLAQREHDFLLCVFGNDADWKIQTIQDFDPEGNGKTRMYLPEEWAGLSALELQLLTGVKDAVFCHNGRFIAGAGSKTGAMNLAALAINLRNAPAEKTLDPGLEGDALNSPIDTELRSPELRYPDAKKSDEPKSFDYIDKRHRSQPQPAAWLRTYSGNYEGDNVQTDLGQVDKSLRHAAAALVASEPPLNPGVYLTTTVKER